MTFVLLPNSPGMTERMKRNIGQCGGSIRGAALALPRQRQIRFLIGHQRRIPNVDYDVPNEAARQGGIEVIERTHAYPYARFDSRRAEMRG
jgi:hypothetical protein